jgi:TRAP-type C4-dicarboxylate transport system permease small subunit
MKPQSKYSLEGIVATIIFIILLGVVLLQIVGRTSFFGGPVWTEELARWLWVWMAFIAIGEVERTNTQLNMGFLTELLATKARAFLFTLIDLVYLAVTVNLVWIGYKTVIRTLRNSAVTLPVPDALLYASAFVASILICFRISQRLLSRKNEIFNKEPQQ